MLSVSGVARISSRTGPKFMGPQGIPIQNWKLIGFGPLFLEGVPFDELKKKEKKKKSQGWERCTWELQKTERALSVPTWEGHCRLRTSVLNFWCSEGGSLSVCGALKGLDGQSIYEPWLDSVWVPQRPRCTVNLWGPHQNVGPSVTRMDLWTMDLWGPQSICETLNKVCLLVGLWAPVALLDIQSMGPSKVWALSLSAGSLV